MSESWIDHLPGSDDLAPEERKRLDAVPHHERRYQAGQVLLFEDDDAPMLFAVKKGWAAAVRNLANGSEQILDLFLPGQILGLREVNSLDTILSYHALTALDVRLIRKSDMQELIKHCSPVGGLIFRAIACEEAWLLDRITALGQRNAAQRVVHLLLELADRISIRSDKAKETEFAMPLTQEQLGNIVGITPVHVSRTLKQLNEKGLVTIDTGTVRFLDRNRCEAFSQYDARQMRLEAPDPK